MNIGDKIIYNDVEYTIIIIDNDTVHLMSNGIGICILKTEIQ